MKTLGSAVIGLSKYLGTSPYNAAIKEIAQTISAAWTFTAAFIVSLTSGTTVATFRTADAGTQGPTIRLDHNSASPADGDTAAVINVTANDDLGANDTIAQIHVVYLDVTSGTEDAAFLFRPMVGGTRVTALTVGDGIVGGNATGGAQGFGTGNFTALYINGVAVADTTGLVQTVIDTETAYTSTATVMNFDNSIPQNTEGLEILSATITPTNASNIILVTVDLPLVANGSATFTSAALFVDSTANALAAGACDTDGAGITRGINFSYSAVAGSTTARTYKVRFGPDSGTAYLNGNSTSRIFGGIAAAKLIVQELAV